jgi:hypothetical protein
VQINGSRSVLNISDGMLQVNGNKNILNVTDGILQVNSTPNVLNGTPNVLNGTPNVLNVSETLLQQFSPQPASIKPNLSSGLLTQQTSTNAAHVSSCGGSKSIHLPGSSTGMHVQHSQGSSITGLFGHNASRASLPISAASLVGGALNSTCMGQGSVLASVNAGHTGQTSTGQIGQTGTLPPVQTCASVGHKALSGVHMPPSMSLSSTHAGHTSQDHAPAGYGNGFTEAMMMFNHVHGGHAHQTQTHQHGRQPGPIANHVLMQNMQRQQQQQQQQQARGLFLHSQVCFCSM